MPIQVHCSHCKAGFQAKDEHAGKRAKCPKCGQVLVIGGGGGPAPMAQKPAAKAAASAPAAAPSASHPPSAVPAKPEPALPAGVAAGPTCPSCGAAMAEKAVLCIACGFNRSTGQKVARAGAAVETDDAAAPAAPGCCSACGATMAPGTTVCLRCGVDNRAVESQLRRAPRRSGPTRVHIVALSAFFVLFALVGFQCTRMLFHNYGAQFAALINEHKALAKFDSSLETKSDKEQAAVPHFPDKVLVCGEDGQVCAGFTDPGDKPYLARKPSEVRTILFVRQTDVKVTIAAGPVPIVVPGGAGVPTATGIRVVCQVCIVDCGSKSVLGDDTLHVDPIGPAGSTDVTASEGRGPVGRELAEWIERHVALSGGN